MKGCLAVKNSTSKALKNNTRYRPLKRMVPGAPRSTPLKDIILTTQVKQLQLIRKARTDSFRQYFLFRSYVSPVPAPGNNINATARITKGITAPIATGKGCLASPG